MNFLKNVRFPNLLPSFVLILIGLVFLCIPGIVFTALGYIVGGALLLFGVMQIVTALAVRKTFGFSGIFGVLCAAFGLIVLRYQQTILETIFIVVGILILLDGLWKLLPAFVAKRLGQRDWIFLLIWAVLVMAFGILVIANPFQSSNAVIVLLGVSVLLDGLQNLYSVLRNAFFGKNSAGKKGKASFRRELTEEISYEPIEVDGEVVED